MHEKSDDSQEWVWSFHIDLGYQFFFISNLLIMSLFGIARAVTDSGKFLILHLFEV